jgi:hypothetical protein
VSGDLLSPNVGDVVFNINLGGFQTIYRRLRVTKVTATQIETISVMGRRVRYWRKNGYDVAGFKTNCLALIEPSSPAFEAKHEVGRPLPEGIPS